MKESIQSILKEYPDARKYTGFKGPHAISLLFNTLKEQVAALDFIRSNPNLVVKASYGKGNWATVPWLAVLDSRETSTTQDGTYIVLLFQEDGKGCHLKLAQGVTELEKTLKSRAGAELQSRAEEIRRLFKESEIAGFELSGDVKMEASGKLAVLYEQSTILSRYFSVDEVPDDEQLRKLFETLVVAYGRYIETRLASRSIDESDRARRIWALSAGEGGSKWSSFIENGEIAIGWDGLGELGLFNSQQDIIDALSSVRMDGSRPSNDALCCYQFCHEMSIGDIVVAKSGRKKILGMGIIESDYIYDGSRPDYKNLRKVKWLRTDTTEFPGTGTATKALTEITAYSSFTSMVYEYLGMNDAAAVEEDFNEGSMYYGPASITNDGSFLDIEQIESIIARLRDKKNIILQGPPGTGKTWLAKRLAYALIGKVSRDQVRVVQFHANLVYEDFVRGLRPTQDGRLSLVDGAFMEAIEDARNSTQPLVIVIEEINRGNTAQIFGEMLTLIECDKRSADESIELTYRRFAGERVFIPPNLYIIGTMNIADRSLAIVDLALRRRFAFIELMPNFNVAWKAWLTQRCGFSPRFVSGLEGFVKQINSKITEEPRLGRQFTLGHSYFTPPTDEISFSSEEWLNQVIDTEVRPLLLEYFYESPHRVDEIISDALKEL